MTKEIFYAIYNVNIDRFYMYDYVVNRYIWHNIINRSDDLELAIMTHSIFLNSLNTVNFFSTNVNSRLKKNDIILLVPYDKESYFDWSQIIKL